MVEITSYKEEDKRGLAQCLLSLATSIWEETRDIYFDLELVSVDDIVKNLDENIYSENINILLAKDNQNVIGYIQGDIISCFIPISKVKKVGYISGAYVHPDYRQLGIMRQLEAQIIAFFKSNGVKYAELNVISNNMGAQACWERLGYRTFREHKRKYIG